MGWSYGWIHWADNEKLLPLHLGGMNWAMVMEFGPALRIRRSNNRNGVENIRGKTLRVCFTSVCEFVDRWFGMTNTSASCRCVCVCVSLSLSLIISWFFLPSSAWCLVIEIESDQSNVGRFKNPAFSSNPLVIPRLFYNLLISCNWDQLVAFLIWFRV